MPTARFSTFERVLVKSRSQVDTAVLLLLAWVLTKRQHISEGQRRRRLAQVTAQFRHGHAQGVMFDIARQQDLKALQLAAEVVRSECDEPRRLAIMHQAIALATDDGKLSPANHYVLRFLADVLTIAPATLVSLFQELTGSALELPEDISRRGYWLHHDAAYREEKARQAQKAQEQAEREKAEREKAEREHAEREKARHEQAERARAERERAREEKTRRERGRQESARRERARRENAQHEQRREHERQHRNHREQHTRVEPAGGYQTRRALAVLELSPGASRAEIRRAYRRMAQLHHPDRFYTKSEHHIALASQRFQRIKNAYDYLIKATL
ncbi:DnaJ domain-containing protein [Vreelandella sp. GE22]